MIILLIFAFLARLITVLSPSILPVLPILLAAGADAGISSDFLRYAAILLIAFFGLSIIFEPGFKQVCIIQYLWN